MWGIPADRLYATYFEGAPEQGVPADEEAKAEWAKYLPQDQILPGNMKERCFQVFFSKIQNNFKESKTSKI